MKKNELVETGKGNTKTVEELTAEIAELKAKLHAKGEGKKGQLLVILKEGRISIEDIAKRMGITERNVSTLKSYLKKDGVMCGKDSKGRIYIEEDGPAESKE